MTFDSLIALLSAATLLCACVIAWRVAAALRPASRINLRFAAMLLAAIAAAAPFGAIGDVAALLVLPPAAAALALATLARFTRRAPPIAASLLLASSLGAGLGAVVTASPMLAAVPVALAALVIATVALQDLAWIAALAGAALLAALFAFLAQGAGPGLLLFAALALLGLARVRSALTVDQLAAARLGNVIGGTR